MPKRRILGRDFACQRAIESNYGRAATNASRRFDFKHNTSQRHAISTFEAAVENTKTRATALSIACGHEGSDRERRAGSLQPRRRHCVDNVHQRQVEHASRCGRQPERHTDAHTTTHTTRSRPKDGEAFIHPEVLSRRIRHQVARPTTSLSARSRAHIHNVIRQRAISDALRQLLLGFSTPPSVRVQESAQRDSIAGAGPP